MEMMGSDTSAPVRDKQVLRHTGEGVFVHEYPISVPQTLNESQWLVLLLENTATGQLKLQN